MIMFNKKDEDIKSLNTDFEKKCILLVLKRKNFLFNSTEELIWPPEQYPHNSINEYKLSCLTLSVHPWTS